MKHPKLRLDVDLWDVLHLWKIHATFPDAFFKIHRDRSHNQFLKIKVFNALGHCL